ncbi:MAG: hydroxyphenylacetyl-CoA thioesterase PaaI [Cyanobacteriota/Melainabacteria group bacterium]
MVESKTEKLAMAVANHMEKGDKFSSMLGMKLVSAEAGEAVVSLEITELLVNGHGICHGGVMFSLADTTFAYACNSRNHKTVALNCSISFLAPVKVGQILRATATEKSLKGRTGVYDIAVCDEAGETVALFRGTSYRMKDFVIETD